MRPIWGGRCMSFEGAGEIGWCRGRGTGDGRRSNAGVAQHTGVTSRPLFAGYPHARGEARSERLARGRGGPTWPSSSWWIIRVKWAKRMEGSHSRTQWLRVPLSWVACSSRAQTPLTAGSSNIPTEAAVILEWLEDHGFAACPTVIVYRKAKEMVTRRFGIRDPARSDAIRDQEPSANVQELMEALKHYQRSRVVSPMGCPDGVWKSDDADRYIPGERPEKSIQTDLQIALNFWFRGVVKAEGEDNTNIGRIDVRLLKKKANRGLTYWIILELKVIKSFTNTASSVSDSSNVAAIAKGVRQAGSYRANRDAEEGRLEVYDLRRDKSEDLTARKDVSDALATYFTASRG